MTYTFNLLELILIPIFIILFTVLIMLLSKEKNLSGIDIFYGITASILAVMLGSFIIIILLFLFTDLASIYETKKTLDEHTKIFFSFITPTGIMLSAALASLSVLKNIKNTNMIEKSKEKKEKEETKARLEFHLSEVKQLLKNNKEIESLSVLTFNTPLLRESFKNIESDKKIISQYSKTELNKILYTLRVITLNGTADKLVNESEENINGYIKEVVTRLSEAENNIETFIKNNSLTLTTKV